MLISLKRFNSYINNNEGVIVNDIASDRAIFLEDTSNIEFFNDGLINVKDISKLLELSNVIDYAYYDSNLILFKYGNSIFKYDTNRRDFDVIYDKSIPNIPFKCKRVVDKYFICDGLNNIIYNNIDNTLFINGVCNNLTVNCSENTGGNISKGDYRFAITVNRIDGMESYPEFIRISVDENSKILFNISADGDYIVSYNLYVYNNSMNEYYKVGEYSSNTFEINSIQEEAITLATEKYYRIPNSKVLELFNGRLFYGVSQYLYYSEPYKYEYLVKGSNIIVMDDFILDIAKFGDMLAVSCNDGIYIITKDFERIKISSIPFIFGGAVEIDLSSLLFLNNSFRGVGLLILTEKGLSIILHDTSIIDVTNSFFELRHISKHDKAFMVSNNNKIYFNIF